MRIAAIRALAAFGGLSIIGLLVAAGAFLLDRGPFANTREEIETLSRVVIDVRLCPAGTIGVGTNADAICIDDIAGVSVRVTGNKVDEQSPIRDRLDASFDRLPITPLSLSLEGVAAGTTDVLSCRTYAIYADTEEVAGSVALPVSYGGHPLTATIQPLPYLHLGFPDNRWQATAEIPSANEAAANPLRYVRVVRCKWFLLPPGAFSERPGLVRTYTSAASAGEPDIHVLGPGGPTDVSAPTFPDNAASGPVTFDLRSQIDGTTFATNDNAIDGYLVPAGTWVVTDRTTGQAATLDVAPGQTVRIVSVIAIVPPGGATPAATQPA